MQISQIPYPVWNVLPNRTADNPNAVREAINFLARHKFFCLNQTQDAKHLAWLFMATDLAASGLSQEEIKAVIAFENAHPILYYGPINRDNCYEILKGALMEGYVDTVADCFIFMYRLFHDEKELLTMPDREDRLMEVNTLIKAMKALSKADISLCKQKNSLQIAFKGYEYTYDKILHYLSLFVPVSLRLGDARLSERDLIELQNCLPYITINR